jgi:hypothetical protein
VPPLNTTPTDTSAAALREEAERVQASGVLGEARLRQLFDYLVTRSLAGQSPKEIAIAIDVFGKGADFDVSQDALVRVYMHKLRKALDDFYASARGDGQGRTLRIPRGEYRLKLSVPEPLPASGRRTALTLTPRMAVLGTVGLLTLAVLIGFGLLWLKTPRSELDRVRASPIWSAMIQDDRPIMIVVGDYYLIGETDNSMEVKRLIREYSVNSKSDLDNFIAQHPELADRYMDVGTRYLPIAAASALRNVVAVLAPENRRIVVTRMSDVEASSLKSSDIVYIGYLSGMGMLQDLIFTGSRFAVGESYDEVIDKQTRHAYISQTGSQVMAPASPSGRETPYHDYGLFAKFLGPGGNSIVVLSGTRDEGVQQTAEAFTSVQKLQEFARQADVTLPFEALLEVSAFDGVNLSGKLLVESKRDWTGAPRQISQSSAAAAIPK